MRWRWRLALLGAVIGLGWVGAERSVAGTYDVFSCRLPDSTRIPTAGWSPVPFSAGGVTVDECRLGGALVAALDPAVTIGQSLGAGWEFNAPPDTDIAAYTVYRTSRVNPEAASRASLIYHDAPVFDGGNRRFAQELCGGVNACTGWGDPTQPFAPTNRYSRAGLQIRRLIAYAQCMPRYGSLTCPPVGAPLPQISVHASQVTLSDPHAPAFATPPTGTLVDATAPIEGRRTASFLAEDRGGGVAAVAIVVDGRLVSEQPADPNWKSCRQPYTVPVPCPLSTRGSIEFDTSQVANGAHALSLALIDAAGNRTLSSPVTVTVRNPGAANGVRASRLARLEAWFESRSPRHRSATTLRFGRTRAIVGRLVDESGAPISDAVLDLTATATRPGARTRSLGQTATDRNGRFRYLPRSGSSRRLTIGYRAFHLDTAPSASADVTMHVRAGVALSVRPTRVSPTGRIGFTGRLIGGPGRAGTQVVIYAIGGRARDRIPVATVRANARGRFRYRYRFRNSSPGVTYRFRATLHAQRAYPYATGSSRVVTVRIR